MTRAPTHAVQASRGGSAFEVLLVQGDPSAARAVEALLAGAAEGPLRISRVHSCEEGIERLREGPTAGHAGSAFAAVLVDLFLVDIQGVDTHMRSHAASPSPPVLVLVPGNQEDLARIAIQRGARDHLIADRHRDDAAPRDDGSASERATVVGALDAAQEHARLTLDSIGDGVISSGLDGRIRYLNPVAERLTGWTREQAIGRPLEEVLDFVDATTHERIQNPLALAMAEDRAGGPLPDCMLIRRDGVEVAIEDSAAPIRDGTGASVGAVMVFRDVSCARSNLEKLAHQAHYDPLTDLPNRVLLHDRLRQAIAIAKRHVQKAAVLFVDLDGFKDVNDRHGHEVGDRLLQSVAGRLVGCVRDCDTVSRVGGDEFVVLLSEIARGRDAAVSAERILTALGAAHHIGDLELHMTASIGIALYPDDGESAEALVICADAAMYRAKATDRNCSAFSQDGRAGPDLPPVPRGV
jgi:diguanylate cyclase (GGDEF)-like protein/PAS domain S-box-containing protein